MCKKIDDLNPILSKIFRPVAAIKSLRFALFSSWTPFQKQASQSYYIYKANLSNIVYIGL